MSKKTIIGLAIATILTAYISAPTPNQAFGKGSFPLDPVVLSPTLSFGQILAGHEAQLGKVLGGHSLGDVRLSWGR